MFIAIMHVVNNRVAKFADFPTAEQASAHVAAHLQDWPNAFVAAHLQDWPNAFVVEDQGGSISEWWVEGQTITIVPVPPTPLEIEKQEYTATRNEIKLDPFVQNFITMTPTQVAQYIETNVTNLATAKDVIKKMAVMLLLLARREFR